MPSKSKSGDWAFPWGPTLLAIVLLLLVLGLIVLVWTTVPLTLPKGGTLFLVDLVPLELGVLPGDRADVPPPVGQVRYAFQIRYTFKVGGNYIFYLELDQETGEIKRCRGCRVGLDKLDLSRVNILWLGSFRPEYGFQLNRLF